MGCAGHRGAGALAGWLMPCKRMSGCRALCLSGEEVASAWSLGKVETSTCETEGEAGERWAGCKMPLTPEPPHFQPSAPNCTPKLLRRRESDPTSTHHRTEDTQTNTLSGGGEGGVNFKRLLKQKKKNEVCERLRYLK